MVISKTGLSQEDLVDLLDRATGRLWIPVSAFNDIGLATLGAVGGSTPTGMTFDAATGEAVDVTILCPKDMDVTKAASIYVYWSSADTNGTDCVWDIDYIAVGAGDDVGAATANLTTTDTDSTTADDLNISDALTLPANTMASTAELLSLSVNRDADEVADDLAADATFYGIRIDYETLPNII